MHVLGIGAPELALFAVILVLLAVIPASLARKKGYSFVGFYVFGLFFWLVALVVVLVIRDKKDDNLQNLMAYKSLLDAGAITQAEFDRRKAELLPRSQHKGSNQ